VPYVSLNDPYPNRVGAGLAPAQMKRIWAPRELLGNRKGYPYTKWAIHIELDTGGKSYIDVHGVET
jgi:hypothetical protein